jgi:hypothetical protein
MTWQKVPLKPEFYFYTDPGHGWLEVPRALLHELGIAEKISAYSYQRGETVFLEEDCDYFRFHQAMTNAGREYKTVDINQARGDSFVRSLARYQVEATA